MDSLITDNTKLVWSIARRFMGRGYDLEDLYQTGCIGLVKAAGKFDVSFGTKFSTYAVPVITGEILRLFRDEGTIKVSRELKQIGSKINAFKAAYVMKEGCDPSISTIAEALGVSQEKVVEAIGAQECTASLDEEISNDKGGAHKLMDIISSESGMGSENEMINKAFLQELFEKLDSTEKTVIKLRHVIGLTQQEIAEKLNFTQVKVSRIEKRVKEKLKAFITQA